MTRVEIDQKFDEIVDFSGVEKFIDTPVKFYPSIELRTSSSGMRVHLAFSVAHVIISLSKIIQPQAGRIEKKSG